MSPIPIPSNGDGGAPTAGRQPPVLTSASLPVEHRPHDRRAVERLPDAPARAASLCMMSAERLLAAVNFRPDPGVDTPGPEREPPGSGQRRVGPV
jgi:hypothetical protein